MAEVVGERSGLHFDRRIFWSFPVLPPNVQGAGLRSTLTLEGWTGGWKAINRRDEIRRGIWGDYSQVMATVSAYECASFGILS